MRRFGCGLQGVSHFVEVLVGRPVDIPKRPSTSGYNRPGGPPIKSIASTFLATISLFAVALNAFSDQVAVNWSGNPVIVSTLSNAEYMFAPVPTASEDGADADLGIAYNAQSTTGTTMSSVVDTQFTIASAADIALAVTLSMQDLGFSCGDVDCPLNLTSWTFSGAFSGSLDIVDANGGVDLSVPFGDAGSVVAPCNVDGFGCVGRLYLSDTESGSVELAVGTYTPPDRFQLVGQFKRRWRNTGPVVSGCGGCGS